MASQQFDRFKSTLRELFMLDQADLDFGIYRIMNQKRRDVENYLNHRLPAQVKTLLEQNASNRSADLQKQLNDAISQAQNLGVDPNTLPKVKELRKAIEQQGAPDELENSVYSHLATFFSRYYDGGDFISLRRYKKDVYAIPYEGEEVKLHWANADQYYIKTGEYFRTYSFKLNDGKKVEFTLKEATTEQNNNLAQNNMERRFALYEDCPVEVDGDTLHINFTYELYPKATKQKKLIEEAYNNVKDLIPAEFMSVLAPRPTDKDRSRTLLQKHLNDYVAKNTFDYFIHKDLRGFLSRELDFYIKNEVLFIDDINARSTEEFLQHLTVIKAIKAVGQSLIDFLAQLEEFQKRLWLKKKFVIQADWCITLDRVPHELFADICANDAQRAEWIRLFAIDEIKADSKSGLFSDGDKVGYSEPLTVAFLEQNPFLVLDTAFFSIDFKHRLLASIPDLDAQTDGLLINSENFQALQLLQEKYKKAINGIYIDPPYNTDSDDFFYKDGYKDSTWMSMMCDRLLLARNFQIEDSAIFVSINENELYNLEKLLNQTYGTSNYISSFTVKVRHEDRILKGDKEVHEVYENLCIYKNSHEFELKKRTKDNTSFEDYNWEVIPNDNPDETVIMGGKKVDIFYPGSFRFKKHPTGSEKYLKRISVRGSIREGNSSGRFYVSNIEILPNYDGCLFRADGIGAGALPYRWFWKPDKESGRKNGDYFQDVPLDRKDVLYIPYPNFVDFEKEFNNCADEGGVEFRNGKKPVAFLTHVLDLGRIKDNLHCNVLDFFGGSGSTGHTVINLNRADNGQRKYILIEMGGYFDTVTKPRIEKVIYSKDWKGGKPVSREGSSHCFKYMRLEQYEDTLNNLTITPRQTATEGQFADGFLLGYMLDVETRDSLLNLEWFINPFDVKLNITRQNETVDERIDLPETFNYIIGLNVAQMSWPKPGIMVVDGTTRAGKKALIIWRDCNRIDNKTLNDFFSKSAYSVRDNEFDIIYVNGDNNLENLRTDEDTWKVTLIEQEFNRKMFQ